MKKSVNLYYDTTIHTKQKLNIIKQVGYDEFFTGINIDKETLNLNKQIKYAKKLGLKCSMIHCRYFDEDTDNFWLDNKFGKKIFKSYCRQIKKCKGKTNNFVVHLHGSINSVTSQVELLRVEKLLNICEKLNINLCVENLLSTKEIPFIFKNIKHKNLKICFDTGHKNFATKNLEILRDFGDYVVVLHIHDNFGEQDEHLICGKGNIDWDTFAKEVFKYNLTLCAEIKVKSQNNSNVLKDNFDALYNLEKKINTFKKI